MRCTITKTSAAVGPSLRLFTPTTDTETTYEDDNGNGSYRRRWFILLGIRDRDCVVDVPESLRRLRRRYSVFLAPCEEQVHYNDND